MCLLAVRFSVTSSRPLSLNTVGLLPQWLPVTSVQPVRCEVKNYKSAGTCCRIRCTWGKCKGKKKRPPIPHHHLPSAALLELRCRAHTVCTHPVKEQAINKERAIYEHFLSAALWKHITWRRDPTDPVLSQHPEHETTLADLQG